MHGTFISMKVWRKRTIKREAFAAKPFQIYKDMDKNKKCSFNYAGVSTNPT
jgi:hypothetical protein